MVRRLLAIGAVGLFAAGCTSGAPSPASVVPTTASTPQPPIVTSAPLPTETPTVAPATVSPTQLPALDLDHQALAAAFEYWLAFLNGTQQPSSKTAGTWEGTTYLKMQIDNLADWQSQVGLVESGGASSLDMQVSWVGGQILPRGSGGQGPYWGEKTQGVKTLRNFSGTPNPFPLDNVQKRAGVTWNGQVEVKFDAFGSENQYWPSPDTVAAKLSTVQAWIFRTETDPPYWQPFLEPDGTPDSWYMEANVTQQDGKWTVGKPFFVSYPSRRFENGHDAVDGMLVHGYVPLPVMANPIWCNAGFYPNTDCQVITETLHY